ncbi:hypothetical protein MANES_07G054720v8 [Manihot esculenta]|uniref:Uncharacterized protein n=1 Tax=Manihot esculenta TaxID=3983 RepID=A0ACB7HDS5_MANES|nr:hypothetical protein MANES_07G054720v8 [Manihot esculenta]
MVFQFSIYNRIKYFSKKAQNKMVEILQKLTTEEVVKNWITKRVQFSTVSYAGKLTLQAEPSFGAQKAQYQALLTAAKTPKEYKMICQQMFNHLASGESIKKEKIKQTSNKESSKKSSDKKYQRRHSAEERDSPVRKRSQQRHLRRHPPVKTRHLHTVIAMKTTAIKFFQQ